MQNLTYNFFKWRYETSFEHKVALAFIFAAFTGLGAQVRIPLPFTPVPITGQVFFVLLSGILLGKNYGALSQGIYISLGGIGVPWFAPKAGEGIFSRGGISVLFDYTGGYLLGFIIAAWVVGWFIDSFIRARTLPFQLSLMLSAVLIIYAFGALQFSFVMHTGLRDTLIKAVLPFIPGDILKALGAAVIGSALLPKISYNGELDIQNKKHIKNVDFAGLIISVVLAVVFFSLLLNVLVFPLEKYPSLQHWYLLSTLVSLVLILHFSNL